MTAASDHRRRLFAPLLETATRGATDGEKLAAIDALQRLRAPENEPWEQFVARLANGGGAADPNVLRENQRLRSKLSSALADADRYRAEAETHRAAANRLRQELALERAVSFPGWREPRTTSEKLDRCAAYSAELTEWERGLVFNLSSSGRQLSLKQQERLDEIVAKLRRIARLRGEAA